LRGEVVEFIETVLVCKFPQLTQKEIEAMFTLDDLKHTRVYQEAQEEGRQEGRQEGLQDAILRLLSRKLGQVSPKLRLQVEALAIPQLEELTEALLDFVSIVDLKAWFRGNT
jgi:predicted transposase YdaD